MGRTGGKVKWEERKEEAEDGGGERTGRKRKGERRGGEGRGLKGEGGGKYRKEWQMNKTGD